MANSKLGTKQLCPDCEVKFYDLNKRPATCPKCGSSFEPDEEEALSLREKVKAKAPVPTPTSDDDAEEPDAETNTADEDDEGEEETVAELGTEDESVIVADVSDDEDDGGKTVPAGFTEQGVDDDAVLDDDDEEFDIDAAIEDADALIADAGDSN